MLGRKLWAVANFVVGAGQDVVLYKRMARDFSVTLYTKYHPSDINVAESLWSILDSPFVKPEKFDSVERAKIRFTPRSYSDAAAIYADESVLFVKGKANSFLAFFSREIRGLSVWRFFMDRKSVTAAKRTMFIEWLKPLCGMFPVFFGFGCTEEELDGKHLVLRTVPEGRIQQRKGLSVRDFFKFLPGVYWLTLLGPELTETFNRGFTGLSGLARPAGIDGNQTMLFLHGPPLPEDLEERIRTGRKAAEILGPDHFFDLRRGDTGTLRLPETLRTALDSLSKSKD